MVDPSFALLRSTQSEDRYKHNMIKRCLLVPTAEYGVHNRVGQRYRQISLSFKLQTADAKSAYFCN